jgi:limonene-1,2-epoxide hydrolase
VKCALRHPIAVAVRLKFTPVPLLDVFFKAFSQRDPVAMGSCYHEAARFTDPVFVDLIAAEARAMWRMLLGRGTDLRITYRIIEENAEGGRCRWEALYTFSRTGRPVRNVVTSTFRFRDGLIVDQRDRFDFWCWARQALGTPGLLLGWSPMLRRKVRSSAREGLAKAMAKVL